MNVDGSDGPLDAYDRSGRYKLYRLAAGAPMVGEVLPKQVGRPLRFVVQKRLDGRWRFHESSSFNHLIERDGDGVLQARPAGNVPDPDGLRCLRLRSGWVAWRYLKMTQR